MARKRKYAGITERKDGRLQLDFTVDGRRYHVYGQSVKECREKELEKREEIRKGIERRKNPTVSEYIGKWLKNREKKVSEATQRTQEHITRTIGKVPVQDPARQFGTLKLLDVTVDDLQEVQSKLLEGWKPKEDAERKNAHKEARKRKTQTVNDYMSLLGHIFRDAKKERLIDFNPVEAVENLKKTEERARDTIHRALSQQEQAALFSSQQMKESSYHWIFQLAVSSGMRAGEIGALQYGDLRKGYIHVERTITRDTIGRYYIGDSAKTEAGKRRIPITPEIREALDRQKENNVILYGNVISSTDTIFKAPLGGLLMSTPADRELKGICKKIGIEPVTMHGLRATFATRCIESGMNPRTLQELLGHTNFNLTMSLYGHVLPGTLAEEMARVKAII